MHGRKRSQRDAMTEEEKNKNMEKVFQVKLLISKAMKYYKNKVFSEESLQLTATILQQNPEIYTLWNFRRIMIINKLKTDLNGSDFIDRVTEVIQTEFELSFLCLSQRNPKSYCTWYQRKWLISLIERLLKEKETEKRITEVLNFDKELKLCSKLLQIDERNFHCWNYRTFIIEKKFKLTDVNYYKHELQFTLQLIQRNFSNFSAWHRRIVIFKKLLEHFDNLTDIVSIKDEFLLVHNANFTEPADQSAWIYRKFLMELLVTEDKVCENEEKFELIRNEMKLLKELLELEPSATKNLRCLIEFCLLLKQNNMMKEFVNFADEHLKLIIKELISQDKIRKELYLELEKELFDGSLIY